MYSFQIKKRNTQNKDSLSINDFLSTAYPDAANKFVDGFVREIVSLLDAKAFKNKQKTHGGTLVDNQVRANHRYFDIMIDGGLTGIEQFLVDDDGKTEIISRDKIVGLKFFARFWLPAGGKTGYMFLQKYEGLSLKPLFDAILREILLIKGFSIAGMAGVMKPTTTKKRLEKFLEESTVKDITVYSRRSDYDTGPGDAKSVLIKLQNVKINISDNGIDRKSVGKALEKHGFTLGDRYYDMSATYSNPVSDEEKTTKLGGSINIIPNIIIPGDCIDGGGYPLFEKMITFVDKEIEQIKKEEKL